MNISRRCIGLTLLFVIAVVAPAGAADDEHPYRDLEELGQAHKAREAVDWESFEAAVAHYPRQRSGHQTIAMGRYMAWKIVNLFLPSAPVQRIWLHSFEERCHLEAGFAGAPTVVCGITTQVGIRVDGRRYRFAFSRQGESVGRHFRTDDPEYAPTRYAEVRKPVDMAIDFFARRLRQEGLIPE